MAVFSITSFSTFAGLLLAAQRLATDPNPLNRVKALADLASNGKALAAALRDTGLSPLAAEMTRQAEEHALHFTHPGRARDDAIALFWQVAPAAFADPAVFAAADLDPDRTTEAMVAAIKASPLARDFSAAPLPEAFFRAVTRQTLGVMLAKADYIASITPELWRETLRRHGIAIELLQAVKDDTAEILALVRELREIKATTVHQDTLIAIARKIRPTVPDRAEALRELEHAADIAADLMDRGRAGSNVDAFVDGVLRRLAALTGAGRLDEAAAEADRAVDQAGAGLRQLLDAAVDQRLLARDAEGAARQIVRRLLLGAPDPGRPFDALRLEWNRWYERGRDRGLRLHLEVAIALARTSGAWAGDADQRGAALTDLGTALAVLGVRDSGPERLAEAAAVYGAALEEWTRARNPRGWAMTQMNLGNVLAVLGAREGGTARLEEAVQAYRAALEERTRERTPLDWATSQMNLGNALRALGARESGTARLEEAVDAYRAALEERTRERVPLAWATTQNNLGTALRALGERNGDLARLGAAVAAFRAALEEWPRAQLPLDWAMAENNLGHALRSLGEREAGTARLQEAVTACRAALEERTRERAPVGWAETQHQLGAALRALGEREGGTTRLEEAAAVFRAALQERTRERVPLDWATTTGNLGVTLRLLAERTRDAAMARRALDQITAAERVLREAGHAPHADYYAGQIAPAAALVARLQPGEPAG